MVNLCPTNCTPGEKGKFGLLGVSWIVFRANLGCLGYLLTVFSARQRLLGCGSPSFAHLLAQGSCLWGLWSSHHCQPAGAACSSLALSGLFHSKPFQGRRGRFGWDLFPALPVTVQFWTSDLAWHFQFTVSQALDALLRTGFLKGIFSLYLPGSSQQGNSKDILHFCAALCVVWFQSLAVPRVCDYSLI